MTFAGDKKNLVYFNDQGSLILINENMGKLNETVLWKPTHSNSSKEDEYSSEKDKKQIVTIFRDAIFAFLGNGQYGTLIAPFNKKFTLVQLPLRYDDKSIKKLAISPTSLCILTEDGATLYKIKNGATTQLNMRGLVDVQAMKENFLFLTETGFVFEYYLSDHSDHSNPTISIPPSITGCRVAYMNCSSDKLMFILDNGYIQLFAQNYTDSFLLIEEERCFKNMRPREYAEFRSTRNFVYFMSSLGMADADLFNFFRIGHNNTTNPLLSFFLKSLKPLYSIPMPIQLLVLYDLYYNVKNLHKNKKEKKTELNQIKSNDKNDDSDEKDELTSFLKKGDNPHLFVTDLDLKIQEIDPRGCDEIGFKCGDQIQLSDAAFQNYDHDFTVNSTCVVLGTLISKESKQDELNGYYNVCLGLVSSIGCVNYPQASFMHHLLSNCNNSTGVQAFFVKTTKKDALLKWRLLWRFNALLKDINIGHNYIIQVDTSLSQFKKLLFKPEDVVIHSKYGRGIVKGIRCNLVWVQFESRAYSFKQETIMDHLTFIQRKNKQIAIVSTQKGDEYIELTDICDTPHKEGDIIPIRKIDSFSPKGKYIVQYHYSACILVGTSNKSQYIESPLSINFYQDENGLYQFNHIMIALPYTLLHIMRSPVTLPLETIGEGSSFIVDRSQNAHPVFYTGDIVRTDDGSYAVYFGKWLSTPTTSKNQNEEQSTQKSSNDNDNDENIYYVFQNEYQYSETKKVSKKECASYTIASALYHKYYITALDATTKKEVKLSLDCSLYFDSDDINSNSVFRRICKLLDKDKDPEKTKKIKYFMPSDVVLYKGKIRQIVGFDENCDYYLSCENEKTSNEKKILVEKFDEDEYFSTDVLLRHTVISSSESLPSYSENFTDLDSDSESSDSSSSYSTQEQIIDDSSEQQSDQKIEYISFSNDATTVKQKGVLPLQTIGDDIILGVNKDTNSIVLTKSLTERKCFLLPHLPFPIPKPVNSLI